MAVRMAAQMEYMRADTMAHLKAVKMADLMANWTVEPSDGQGVEKKAY